MDKSVNARLGAWYKLLKKSGIVKNQNEIASTLTNRDGEPVSQSFVSAFLTGSSSVPDYMIPQIVKAFPFTSEDFFLNGNDEIINIRNLIYYLLEKHNVDRDKLLDETGISSAFLTQLTHKSDRHMVQDLLNYFNSNFDYNMALDEIHQAGFNVGGYKEEFKGSDDYTIRFLEVVDHVIKHGLADSKKELCEQIGITPSHLSNMTHPGMRAKVSPKMLASLVSKFPSVSIEYILSGKGGKLKDNAQVINEIIEIRKDILQNRQILASIQSKLFEPEGE